MSIHLSSSATSSDTSGRTKFNSETDFQNIPEQTTHQCDAHLNPLDSPPELTGVTPTLLLCSVVTGLTGHGVGPVASQGDGRDELNIVDTRDTLQFTYAYNYTIYVLQLPLDQARATITFILREHACMNENRKHEPIVQM